jgi:TatD DNase family protein
MLPDDLGTVLQRSLKAGLDRIIVTAGSLDDFHDARALLDRHGGAGGLRLATTLGFHPTRCMELERLPDQLALLREAFQRHGSCVAALGELGLDYDRLQFCPRDVQLKWFDRQMALCDAIPRPLFLHMRAAGGDFVRTIREHRHRFGTGVVHSFTGSLADAQAILAQGLYIGVNGCSLRTEGCLEVVRQVPLDRIMVESDAPWCDLRRSHAGFPHVQTHFRAVDKERYTLDPDTVVKGRNEPLAARQALEVVAALHAVSVEHAAAVIYESTCSVFSAGFS